MVATIRLWAHVARDENRFRLAENRRSNVMRRILAAAFVLTLSAAALSDHEAMAACTVPNTLTNGTTADATQVMTNFNAVASCTADASNLTSGDVGAGRMTTNLSPALDGAFGSTQGSILYRSGSGWTVLTPGTSGYVLSTNGATAAPSWVAQSGGGGGGGNNPPFSPPVASQFSTWVNQQSASLTDNTGAGGPLVITTTQNTGGDSVNAALMAVPSGSWTLTINASQIGHRGGASNAEPLPIVLYDSVSGMLWTYGLIPNANGVVVTQYSSPTNWSGSSNFTDSMFVPQMWYRVKYISSPTPTMNFYFSLDGYTWLETYTTTSLWITPTHFGIGLDTQSNPGGQLMAVSLYSWSVTSP
jgi:hypothetical protein